MAQLMRIQITKGWSVMDNKFYDVDPLTDKDKYITNWYEGFMDDVLWIREHKFNTNGEFIFPDWEYFSIGLSWLPESTINGQYHLKLHWNGIHEMKEMDSLDSVNRILIREKMEMWMEEIGTFYKRIK